MNLYTITARRDVEITCTRLRPLGGPGTPPNPLRIAEPETTAEETRKLKSGEKLNSVTEIVVIRDLETGEALHEIDLLDWAANNAENGKPLCVEQSR